MIRKFIVTTGLAIACSGALATAQQPAAESAAAPNPEQQGQRPQTPGSATTTPTSTQATPPAGGRQANMTFVGCLYTENQIPGRTPNVAERAGIREDYILANATMGGASTAPGATAGAAGTSGTRSASPGKMYKVEKIADDRLKTFVGKRVEVTGKVDPEGSAPAGAATADKGLGPDAISLSEIEADSIREVAGTCPATP